MGEVCEKENLKDPSMDGKLILKFILNKQDGDVHWIDLAQDRDKWRAPVNKVMNLRVPQSAGNLIR